MDEEQNIGGPPDGDMPDEEVAEESAGEETERPQESHEEANYLRQLAQSQTPVAVKLRSGEIVHGFVEYYDRRFIRLTRDNGSNLFIFKKDIRYLYEEEPTRPVRRMPPQSRG